jgi:hypothetical protein
MPRVSLVPEEEIAVDPDQIEGEANLGIFAGRPWSDLSYTLQSIVDVAEIGQAIPLPLPDDPQERSHIVCGLRTRISKINLMLEDRRFGTRVQGDRLYVTCSKPLATYRMGKPVPIPMPATKPRSRRAPNMR